MTLKITSDEQSTKFKQHLDAERNERIIFSGAFGIGKTHFLQQYFSKANTDYLAIRLSPVNYSVSSNEDIFQLIKYDILFELMAVHRLTLEADPIDRSIAYPTLLPTKINSILQGLIGMVPLLNKDSAFIEPVVKSINSFYDVIESIEEQRKDPELTKPVLAFAEKVAATSLLEIDYITRFLEDSLNELKQKRGARFKVLVIDDLDRIDPEHIFRLFNIFSAHLDYNSSSNNKFGFDKVVFVCDIHNIRTIFHSRYGADTDFNGYIDKFYSLDMFHFDNRQEVKRIVDEFAAGIGVPEGYQNFFELYIKKKHRRRIKAQLPLILEELVHAGALKLRRIATTHQVIFPFVERKIRFDRKGREVGNWQIPIVVVLEMLQLILGGTWALEAGLKKLASYEKSQEYTDQSVTDQDFLVGNLLPILDYEQHKFKSSHSVNNSDATGLLGFEHPQTKQFIAYQLLETGESHDQYYGYIKLVDGDAYHSQELDYFSLLYLAFTQLKQIGYFS
ncbi:P-loop NTPase fold protein [Hymenobacter rigui]|uniref:KAP NTPase domain-containing protein n=1 Tax=Hymenobacter rigui TaxID=334424 RepID=A0A428KU08_9BACT|nr:P-loop NTPase fold protein [Hymenobacter rigui]RSK50109.1 hypothetical protein EI291_05510 [Hymenobacter rigui]